MRARPDRAERATGATSTTTATSTRSARSPTRAASSARCCTPAPTSGWAPTPPTTSSAARSTRSTSATSDALDAADRAFLFKTTVKEMAAPRRAARHVHRQAVERRRGLRVPPAHLARLDDARQDLLNDAGRPGGPLGGRASLPRRPPRARPGADGVLQPDDERLPPHPRGGARADAGQLGPRQPAHPRARAARARQGATRVELRVGDGAANPYLAVAAALFAGLDGIERELEPPRSDRAA